MNFLLPAVGLSQRCPLYKIYVRLRSGDSRPAVWAKLRVIRLLPRLTPDSSLTRHVTCGGRQTVFTFSQSAEPELSPDYPG